MLKIYFLILFSFSIINLSAQPIPAYLANWKNDAQGAYSIIHDDYGDVGVDGIWQYADTIAYNRGLKFTFGAISSACEVARTINGQPSPYAYAKNVMMDLHGHEIINHSHTHTCAVNRGWSPCSGTGWGEIANTASWNLQLNTSHQSILTNTGHQPRYYIYPYDQFTDLANSTLQSMGYLGSRTGWHVDGIHSAFYKYGYEANDENMFLCNSNGFFRTSVQVFDDVDAGKSNSLQTAELNAVVNAAIANNQWGNRELHNVGASGWGHVTVNAYRDHLNYVKTKVNSGELWMATVSEILTYQIQKLVFDPTANFDSNNDEIVVSFSTDNSLVTADIGAYLDVLTIKSPVTVVIDVSSYTTLLNFNDITITQGSSTLSDYFFENEKLYVSVFPHLGAFTIKDNALALSNNPNKGNEMYPDNSSFLIYPNPASSIIKVKNDSVHQLEIYSIDGYKVIEVPSNQADISNLPSGLYYISIKEFGIWEKFLKK